MATIGKRSFPNTGHLGNFIRQAFRTGLVLAALVALPAGLAAQEAVDRLGLPGPLAFDGTEYRLAWSAQPNPTYYKQEYLPADETVAEYTRMVLVELLAGGANVAGAAKAQVDSLNQRKGKDPLVQMALIRNAAAGEILLDFLVSQKNPWGEFTVEWNAYRYVPRGDGVMLFAISRRAYGNEAAKAFLGRLKTGRPADIAKLARYELPRLRLQGDTQQAGSPSPPSYGRK